MKKFLNKIKKTYKDFMSGKAAFSLVELIVVIAIMAVMAAVLAPALLGYVEKSRMQKDDSAMDEVVNAMQLSLADQEIYDEVLEHSVWDNVSCYIDQKEESKFASHKVTLKAEHGDKKEQYMFGDEARLLDETVYYAAGNMRGLTITFSPSESGDTYDFANGILNKFVGRKTGYLHENPELYNRLRSVIGDKLDTTSQTYRNSDYTIFIRVGSTGGDEAVMQDAIQVWGQFNGTNLVEKDHKFELSGGRVVGSSGENDVNKNNNLNNEDDRHLNFSEQYSNLIHDNQIAEGAKYITASGKTIESGKSMPSESVYGDKYYYGDYYYHIQGGSGGWQVHLNEKVVNRQQEYYGPILEEINGIPVKSIYSTFHDCVNMKYPPKIPATVTAMNATFLNCTSLVDLSTFKLPSNLVHCGLVNNYPGTFAGCTNLKYAPTLPSTIGYNDCYRMFYQCTSLVEKPVGCEILNQAIAFEGCTQFGY